MTHNLALTWQLRLVGVALIGMGLLHVVLPRILGWPDDLLTAVVAGTPAADGRSRRTLRALDVGDRGVRGGDGPRGRAVAQRAKTCIVDIPSGVAVTAWYTHTCKPAPAKDGVIPPRAH